MVVTRLRLENWRNFSHVDVALGERCFVVGANASGKSNLLDAIRFLRDIAAPDGGLRSAVDQPSRRSVRLLRSLFARRQTRIVIDVDLQGPVLWRYRLELAEQKGLPQVAGERVERDGQVLLERPDEDDGRDPERLTQTHLEQVSANRSFRELAEELADIRYLHVVPQLVRDPERFAPRAKDPYGSDFIGQIAAAHHQTRGARLKRIQQVLRPALPNLAELQLYEDNGRPHLRGRFQHWRPQGAWQTEEQLSDGTLRLIGLLWAVLDGDSPLLLEEPELSLHPALVREVVAMVRRLRRPKQRQLLITTHSRDLLLDPGIDAAEVLLLLPTAEGTRVVPATADEATRALLEGGLAAGDAALPRVAPPDIALLRG